MFSLLLHPYHPALCLASCINEPGEGSWTIYYSLSNSFYDGLSLYRDRFNNLERNEVDYLSNKQFSKKFFFLVKLLIIIRSSDFKVMYLTKCFLFLSNFYSQCGAQTYNLEIKSHLISTLLTELTRHPSYQVF